MTALWIGSCLLIFVLLVLDLRVLRRSDHIVKTKEAAIGTLLWISVSLLFNLFIYFHLGSGPAIDFFTGYLVEYSLSIDNLFVFMLIFAYFQVPASYQRRVLFYGIVGAVLMRGLFIGLGSVVIHNFHWVIYLFGFFLVFSGIKLFGQEADAVEPDKNIVVKVFRKITPMVPEYRGHKFFTYERDRWFATPLFLVLVSVEVSDLVFAVDSIPAIFGITNDPFIIFTSNIFAVLGLRSLYFLLASSLNQMELLRYGLALILIFVGSKMLLESFYPISNMISLVVIVSILTLSIVGSLLLRRRKTHVA